MKLDAFVENSLRGSLGGRKFARFLIISFLTEA